MRKRRFLSVVLALVLALTLLPATALAAGSSNTNDETTSDGLKLSKTATLEADGTYTIDLEAYATGETTTQTVKSGVPLDIVLVIDQSGSMAYNDAGQSTNTLNDRRMEKLKDAVTAFVESISENANEYGVDHKIAIAGYAANRKGGQSDGDKIQGLGYNGSGSYWVNTGLYVNGSFKNYAGNSNTSSLTAQDYKDALVSVNDGTGKITSSITEAIKLFKASGGTYTEYGLTMAQKVFANNPISGNDGRQRIVVLFTDGETNSEISTVLTSANTLKGSAYNATIYSVGFGNDVKTDFLSHVSSNYTTASYDWWEEEYRGTQVADKYSMTASNRDELDAIFQNISQDIQNPTTSVTLDADSVMRDILGDDFTLPESYKAEDNITVKTVTGSTTDGSNITWGTETASPAGVSVDVDGNTIDIAGFNYSEKYIAPSHNGEKLCVTIKGVIPKESAVTGEAVYTNREASGIYASKDAEEPVSVFPRPETILTSKTYVLDYAKEASLSSLDQKNITAIVSTLGKSDNGDNSVTGTYGNASLRGNVISYMPKTTMWNGYDSFYAFGTTENNNITAVSANGNGYLWSRISVLPANNVYYEDDFVTTENTGTIGIKYDKQWETIGNSQGNTETANNAVHGWIDAKNDDTGDSDGSSHVTSSKTATATFQFTGTGVDIYSRTNTNSAKIYVKVSKLDENGTVVSNKLQIVDTKSASGEYYQIPTYTFSGDYGTYLVTLKVQNDAADGAAYAYNIDGIRVYNPIRNLESDSIVQDAYANELGATFTEVRELLQSGSSAFIDNMNDEDGNPTGETGVGDYTDSEIGKIAPAHEIYLSNGQSVVIRAAGADHYYIGLKAPNGNAQAEVSDGASAKKAIGVTSASDLYYEVTPNENGTITIRNTGDHLLSITKLRTTLNPDSASSASFETLDEAAALAAYTAFTSYSVTTYSDESVGVDDEKLAEADGQEQGTVTIENPVPETETVTNGGKQTLDSSWIQNLFNSFKNLFGRR